MPIMAAQPILQGQIQMILSKGASATEKDFASQFTTALCSVVPMGIMMTPFPVPLVPAGKSACENMIRASLSLGVAASTETTSMMMATGISLLAPMAPPAGLMNLKSQIKSALEKGIVAQPAIFASILSLAIPTYYMTGGVL